ncbi:MAG: hypothetical protein NTW04_05605, partial [Elusimicrobia bacterium]|nr:hypothetical protein [Elusimicrobiota bacterium]
MRKILLVMGVFIFSAPLETEGKVLPNDENVAPTGKYLGRVWEDFKELPLKPLHWEGKDWLIAGGVLGASFAAFLVDDDIRQHYRKHRSGFFDDVSKYTTHFGDYKIQAPLLGGIWLAGAVTQSGALSKIAADGMEASLFAAGMVTP